MRFRAQARVYSATTFSGVMSPQSRICCVEPHRCQLCAKKTPVRKTLVRFKTQLRSKPCIACSASGVLPHFPRTHATSQTTCVAPSSLFFISLSSMGTTLRACRVNTTARGFEPLRAEPDGFLVHHLNHTVTLSVECVHCFSNVHARSMAS